MINCAGTATFADDDAVKMSATEIYQHVAMGMPVSLNDQHCQHVIANLCLGGPADTRRTCFHCCHESANCFEALRAGHSLALQLSLWCPYESRASMETLHGILGPMPRVKGIVWMI